MRLWSRSKCRCVRCCSVSHSRIGVTCTRLLQGITLAQFACLARCNAAQCEVTYGDSISLPGSGIPRSFIPFHVAYCCFACPVLVCSPEFRALVEKVSRQSEDVLVLSYSRKTLGQTGSGHFTPVGGYNKEKDMLLLLDVVS